MSAIHRRRTNSRDRDCNNERVDDPLNCFFDGEIRGVHLNCTVHYESSSPKSESFWDNHLEQSHVIVFHVQLSLIHRIFSQKRYFGIFRLYHSWKIIRTHSKLFYTGHFSGNICSILKNLGLLWSGKRDH